MADNRIYRQCWGCNGTGIQRVITGGTGDNPIWENVTCRQCNGEIILYWGEIEGLQDLIDKCNDIMDKCNDIKTVVDAL